MSLDMADPLDVIVVEAAQMMSEVVEAARRVVKYPHPTVEELQALRKTIEDFDSWNRDTKRFA